MPTLHVRNVPEELYTQLQQVAEKENRSLTAEVIALLEDAIRQRQLHQSAGEILQRVRRRSQKVKLPKGWVDSVELIREDRRR